MRRIVAVCALLSSAVMFGIVVGVLALLAAVLPAPMCPRSASQLSDLIQDDDPGRLLVCLYDLHGRLMDEAHILRQSPPVFPTPQLPAPYSQEV
jgi:hypothetical protein